MKGMALTIVEKPAVTGGVDTHADVHVAAALDRTGGLLDTESFTTTPVGYAKLLAWLRAFGPLNLVGVGPAAAALAWPVTSLPPASE